MSRDSMKSFDDNEFLNKAAGVGAGAGNAQHDQMNGRFSHRVSYQREAMAQSLDHAAAAIHDKADSMLKVVNLTHSAADGMQSTASYLRGHDFGDMTRDLVNLCRRYPTQTLLGVLTLGFLLGRAFEVEAFDGVSDAKITH